MTVDDYEHLHVNGQWRIVLAFLFPFSHKTFTNHPKNTILSTFCSLYCIGITFSSLRRTTEIVTDRAMSTTTATTTEHDAFRQWVQQLSYEDLLCAMEFEISEEEYPILTEMVKVQAPPPTPIHPGILGYRPASSVGATDGRNQEHQVIKARFEKPRLFQLIPTSPSIPFMMRNGRSRRQRRVTLPQQPQRFDVIARRKITPWGDVLSIGCTREQQNADTTLLRGTRIHCTTTDKKRNVCLYSYSDALSSADVLRVLHVASRGKFLSTPQSSSLVILLSMDKCHG